MVVKETTKTEKLRQNLPWLVRYPFERAGSLLARTGADRPKKLIFTIADHFEPAWSRNGLLDLDAQKRRLDEYCQIARKTGEAVRDADGTKFRHTNFYPAEQYDRGLLETIAGMQAEGLGEVEIHLHHGIERPDTSEHTRRMLSEFRDCLAEEHRCLSRFAGDEREAPPRYAFVHGNLALANSARGRYCGVDDEMRILQETGCYADLTLPSAPDVTQVPVLNKIYEFGSPIDEKIPHRTGTAVRANGRRPQLPLIFTGPLVFNWTRRIKGIPVPRIDDGALAANQPLDLARLKRWIAANITVRGRPDWIFIKLYCHGFFTHDQAACIGDRAREFFSRVIEYGEKEGGYKVYFASAREAFNMVAAAIDGREGEPGEYRDYRLRSIMDESRGNGETRQRSALPGQSLPAV